MSERKRFPTPITFPTPDQLQNSRVGVIGIQGEKTGKKLPKVIALDGMTDEADIRRKEWLKENQQLGVLPRRERRELQHLQSEDGKKAK
jgi:hypothetical protein